MVCRDAGGRVRVVALCRWIHHRHGRGDQFPGARDIGLAGGAGEEAVMTDAVEPLRQDVEQEAPDELVGREHHRAKPRLPVAAVVLVAKGDAALVESEQAAVRDGDAVGVAGEITEHRLGPGGGRWLGVNEPVLRSEWREVCGEDRLMAQTFELAEERQPARRVGIGEPGHEEPAERAGEHADGEEEAGSA
jgi:hypothetical protein